MVTVERRITELADSTGDRDAIVALARDGSQAEAVSYRQLDHRVNHCARVLAGYGIADGNVVAIALPNSIAHVVATLATWRLGATSLVLDPRSPARESEETVESARPRLFIGAPRQAVPCPVITPAAWGDEEDARPLPEPGHAPRSALATGGTSGRPRVIVRRRSWEFQRDDLPSAHDQALGLGLDQVELVTLPLFHGGFSAVHYGLALRHTIVLAPMFIPRLAATAIERYRVNVVRLVPAMMKMLLEPGGVVGRDMSSLVTVHHGTGPCPSDVKRAWLDLVGPQRVYETYGSQEQLGFVWIRGDDWLAHPGSVGRPDPGALAIVDDRGDAAPPGSLGEIFMRPAAGSQPEYIGTGPALSEWGDGFLGIGDMGYLDDDGYLFIQGRREESINVGGAKVYPPEVEAVLTSYPSVVDACVIARDHPIWGQAPHAMVVSTDPGISLDKLDEFCRQRLSLHKVPVTYEAAESLPRNEAGKLRRSLVQPAPHDRGLPS
jgi:bile acid-coenzyme A ligase